MPNTTLRKGLPVPLITDAQANNYTVGPVGRNIVTTGKVRDEIGAIALLLDTFLEYNQDEAVTGRFDFQAPFITEKGSGQLFVNNTGAQRLSGDVVIADTAVDSSIILPTANGISSARVGVVAETINAAAVGRVAFNGFIRIKVAGGTTRGQYLQTQNTSAIALGTSTPNSGSFAIAVTSPDVNNTVLAYLHPGAASDAESFYFGTTLRSNAATVTAAMLTGISYLFGFLATAQAVVFPDPTITSRPITVAAESGTMNLTATGGTTVIGGSTDQTSGAILNGTVSGSDSFTYKSNGIQWRAV